MRSRLVAASYANQAEKLACFQRVLIIQATTFRNEIRTGAAVTAGDKCFAYGRRPAGVKRPAQPGLGGVSKSAARNTARGS